MSEAVKMSAKLIGLSDSGWRLEKIEDRLRFAERGKCDAVEAATIGDGLLGRTFGEIEHDA